MCPMEMTVMRGRNVNSVYIIALQERLIGLAGRASMEVTKGDRRRVISARRASKYTAMALF